MQHYIVPQSNIIPGQNVFINGYIYGNIDGWVAELDYDAFEIKSDLIPLLHFRLNDIFNNGLYWNNSGSYARLVNTIESTGNPVTGQTGLFYNCVNFNGVSDICFVLPYDDAWTHSFDGFTISLWFKSNQPNVDLNFLSIRNGSGDLKLRMYYNYNYGESSIVVAGLGNDIILPYTNVGNGVWKFLCVSRNKLKNGFLFCGEYGYLTGYTFHYITGSSIMSDFNNFEINDKIWICQDNNNLLFPYDFYGNCMDVRIYDRALTYGEVSAIYNSGLGTFHQDYVNGYPTVRDPVHWYKLDNKLTDGSSLYFLSDSGYLSSILTCIGFSSGNYRQTISGITCTNFRSGDLAYNIYGSPQTGVVSGGINYSNFDFYDDILTTGFTITLWVYERVNNSPATYISNKNFNATSPNKKLYGNSFWSISRTDDGYLQFIYDVHDVTYSKTDWINKWTFVSGWCDGQTIRIYYGFYPANVPFKGIDYEEFASVSPKLLQNGIIIGGEIGHPFNVINSCENTYLYDIRIYDYALSENELNNLYDYGANRILYPKYENYRG